MPEQEVEPVTYCEHLNDDGTECGAEALATATIEGEYVRTRRKLKISVEVCGDHLVGRIQDYAKGRAEIERARAEG